MARRAAFVAFTHRTSVRVTASVVAGTLLITILVQGLGRVGITPSDYQAQSVGAAQSALHSQSSYAKDFVVQRAFSTVASSFVQPSTFEGHFAAASERIGKGDYARALPGIEACIALSQGQSAQTLADLYFKQGCLQALLGSLDEATASIDHALVLQPDMPDAQLVRAQIAIAGGDGERAVQSLSAYLAARPSDVQAQAIMAELCSATGRYDLAEGAYTALLAYPESPYFDPVAYLKRAGCRLLAGRVEDAATDVEAYASLKGAWDADANFLGGLCSMQTGGLDLARQRLSAALEAGYREPSLCYEQLAQCAFLQGDLQEALLAGEKALAGGPVTKQGALLRQMGVAAMSLEQYDKAAGLLSEALQTGESPLEDRYYRGVCYMGLGRMDEAIEDFTTSATDESFAQASLYNRGICYLEKEMAEEAGRDFQSVLTLGGNQEYVTLAQTMLDALRRS